MITERVKELRKNLGLSQVAFGEALGLTRDAVAAYERGISSPPKSVLMLICKTFNVNPDWLENGIGDMFIEMGIEDQIAAFAGSMMKLPQSDPRKIILSALAELPEEQWEKIAQMLVEAAELVVKKAKSE